MNSAQNRHHSSCTRNEIIPKSDNIERKSYNLSIQTRRLNKICSNTLTNDNNDIDLVVKTFSFKMIGRGLSICYMFYKMNGADSIHVIRFDDNRSHL